MPSKIKNKKKTNYKSKNNKNKNKNKNTINIHIDNSTKGKKENSQPYVMPSINVQAPQPVQNNDNIYLYQLLDKFMNHDKREPVKLYHPVDEKEKSPYSLVDHAKSKTEPSTITAPSTKPLTTSKTTTRPSTAPIKHDSTLSSSSLLPKSTTTPEPIKHDSTLSSFSLLSEPIKTSSIRPLTAQPKETSKTTTNRPSSASPKLATAPLIKDNELLPTNFNVKKSLSESPSIQSLKMDESLPTNYNVKKSLSESSNLPSSKIENPLIEKAMTNDVEPTTDLVENAQAQEKANDDVIEIYAKKVDDEPIIIDEAKRVYGDKKEALSDVNNENYMKLKKAKERYLELGGKKDYKKSMINYEKGIDALHYREVLNENDYKPNREEMKVMFDFYNANYQPKIQKKHLNDREYMKNVYNNAYKKNQF